MSRRSWFRCRGLVHGIACSSPSPRPSPRRGEGLDVALDYQVAAEAADVRVDPLEVHLKRLAKARRVDGVRPHHNRVLAVVGVVALAPADDLEAEAFVH